MTNQRSTNQRKPDARNGALDAVSLFGAGSRIPSGPAVSAPQRKGRTHDRSRSVCQITQKNSCIQRAVHTCEERSDEAIHVCPKRAGSLRSARNDGQGWPLIGLALRQQSGYYDVRFAFCGNFVDDRFVRISERKFGRQWINLPVARSERLEHPSSLSITKRSRLYLTCINRLFL